MNKFEQLGLNESLLLAIKDLGFENPSEVQEKAIPVLLEQNTDLVALAQTGTGKTAAFGFPLIQKIDAENRRMADALKNLRKSERRIKEMSYATDEDRKNHEYHRTQGAQVDLRRLCSTPRGWASSRNH